MRNATLAALSIAFVALLATPALADKITLENGDEIDVKIIEEGDDTIVVEHPQLGRMTVPRSALKKPEPPNPGLFGTNFMQGWTRNVGFGFGGASGNSNDASVNASLSFEREADTFRGRFNSTYFYASQNGVKNTNAFNMAYNHDFLLGESRFYIFVLGRYQFDEFQSWRNRISGSGGLGYDIIKHKKGELRGEVGAGVAYETGSLPAGPPPDQVTAPVTRPQGQLGLIGSWRPLEGHEFRADVTYFPDFKNTPEFRLLANAAYQIAITGIDGLNLQLGLTNEYDSSIDTTQTVAGITPPRLQQKNNLKYFGQITYDF